MMAPFLLGLERIHSASLDHRLYTEQQKTKGGEMRERIGSGMVSDCGRLTGSPV
jgi:hypothetical protein